MNAKNPFETMMTQAQQMAQDMAKAVNPALEAFRAENVDKLWPTLPKDFMEMSFGKTLNEKGLDAKTRLLLTVAGLVMQGAQNEPALRLTIRHACEAGARQEEILETIAQMSIFAGLPAMNKALDVARGVFKDEEEAPK